MSADDTPATTTATLASTDAALEAFAAEVGDVGPIAVEGGRTRWELGGRSEPGTRIIPAPTGVVSYAPEEMTITVRAGTSVTDLEATLAERGQRTALPNRGGTIGGALAVGENDIRALGRGLVRTALLQVRYISAEGRIVTSGGPTVKNVTGFDLPRMVVGSLGTLGLIGEAILRTNPIPAVSRWLKADDADPRKVFDVVVAPSAVLYDGASTWVELEGHGVDVDVEQQALATIGGFAEVDGPPELPSHRWSLAPGDLTDLDSDRFDTGAYVAAMGLGLVFAERPQPPRPLAPELAVIGDRLKDNFDPTGRLNPGRNAGRK